MITITSFPPSPALEPYVHFLWTAKTTDSIEAPPMILPPTGYVLLTLFTDPSRYHIQLSGNEFHQVPRAALQGQHYGTVANKTYDSETSTLGIVFKATALHKLWGVNMSEFTHKIVDAEAVLGNELTCLMERLQQDETDQEKVQMVIHFIEQAAQHPYKNYIHAENVVALMHHKQGVVTVRELADYFHCSSRLLEKKFNEQVGVTPKYLNRVIQFNQMLVLLKYSPAIKWAELAYRAGYYDQVHLIKAFIAFTGRSPVQYEEEDNRFTQTHITKNADKEIVTHR